MIAIRFLVGSIAIVGAGTLALSQPQQPANVDTASPGNIRAYRPAPTLLARHFATMFEIGPEAEANYQGSIRRLRATQGATAALIARYQALGDANPQERWQVVETLRELAAPQSLPFLIRIASTPVRPERGVEEAGKAEIEVIIRATATDAIAAIARRRNPVAERTLLALVRSPEILVRRRAIRGYLEIGGDTEARRALLMRVVRPADRDMITTVRSEVRQVEAPQVSLAIKRRNDINRAPAPRVDGR